MLAIFAMNLHAVCQPNMMQIHSNIVHEFALCCVCQGLERKMLGCQACSTE